MEDNLQCTVCSMDFTSEDELEQHMEDVHDDEEEKLDDEDDDNEADENDDDEDDDENNGLN